MTKTRVRKPFMREDAQAHPGLTTEPEEFPAIELPGEEKRSTKVKNAAAAKMPEKVKHPSNLMVRTATGAVESAPPRYSRLLLGYLAFPAWLWCSPSSY